MPILIAGGLGILFGGGSCIGTPETIILRNLPIPTGLPGIDIRHARLQGRVFVTLNLLPFVGSIIRVPIRALPRDIIRKAIVIILRGWCGCCCVGGAGVVASTIGYCCGFKKQGWRWANGVALWKEEKEE